MSTIIILTPPPPPPDQEKGGSLAATLFPKRPPGEGWDVDIYGPLPPREAVVAAFRRLLARYEQGDE